VAHDGLKVFGAHLPEEIVAEIRSWGDGHPLARIRRAVLGHTAERNFHDSLAEALVAIHLLRRGCTLRGEQVTPDGHGADFEVIAPQGAFYLHVKRHDTRRHARRLTISSRLRALERVQRPYVVSVRWHEHTGDAQMQRLVRSASGFLHTARVGDELVVHDDDGTEIGGVLVIAPWDGPHVTLAIGLPTGFIDESGRIGRLLRRAHRQFMPRADNVILIASAQSEDRDDFEAALLGTIVERWDAFPPRGKRIAHGRADDGFWSSDHFESSRGAAWVRIHAPFDRLEPHLYLREWPPAGDRLRQATESAFAMAHGDR